jgi:type IV pilus assembly protein PilN
VIRINLLAVDRERPKRKFSIQSGQQLTIGCTLILVAAALGVGWWYWSLQRDSADLDQQIIDAESETVRLRSVIQQAQEFEARGARLQQRVTLIEQLRKGQTRPVHLLDQVSRALPDAMWLTDMKQSPTELNVEGRCLTLNALSDFVSALEASGLFERPVDIVDSQVQPGVAGAPELIRFTVRAKLRPER